MGSNIGVKQNDRASNLKFYMLIMSIYKQILTQFQEKFGHSEFKKLDSEQLANNLDSLAQINTGTQQFDPIIKQQIFDIVHVTYDKKIILKDLIGTIQKIFDILCKYIAETEKNIEVSTDQQDIVVQKQNIQQFSADREFLCNVFRLPIRSQSKILQKIQNQQVSQFQQSETLKIALILLIIAIILQGVLVLNRSAFLNSLVYCLALGVFILNFFDRSYIRVCILAFIISFLFDLLWSLTISKLYLNSAQNDFNLKFGSLTQIKVFFLKFGYLTSILLMVVKLLLAVIFMRFRNNSIYSKKTVQLGDTKFYLQSKPFVSPISKMIMKNHAQQEVYCL